MGYRVFEVRPKDRPLLDQAMSDDTVSRQSLTLRDASHFGLEGDSLLVFVEGTDAGLLRAEALILEFGRRHPKADELHAKLKAEEEEAAGGVGFIFGDVG